MSRLGASVFRVCFTADVSLKFPLLAAVGAGVAPVWAAAAALPVCLAACGGGARRLWAGRAAGGGAEARAAVGGEMALVVGAGLVYPAVAPLAVLADLLLGVSVFFMFAWTEFSISAVSDNGGGGAAAGDNKGGGRPAAAASWAVVRAEAKAPAADARAGGAAAGQSLQC